jgi:hypothetical protein
LQKLNKKDEPSDLEKEIARLFEKLNALQDPAAESYDATTDQIVKLKKLQLEINSKKRVSPDTLISAATNLAGILLILNYEHAHVFTSKAAAFVWKVVR